MSNILFVTSSALGEASASRKIGLALIDAAKAENKALQSLTRDVSNISHISLSSLGALRTSEAERNAEQQAAALFADTLMEEVEQAAAIIITAPMYSFTIPATLKTWIEYLNRPGRAFKHGDNGDNGDEGLLTGKKVFIVATRGSRFASGDPMNFQESYLKAVLGFFGMTDITCIVAEDTAHEAGKAEIVEAEKYAIQLGKNLAKELLV